MDVLLIIDAINSVKISIIEEINSNVIKKVGNFYFLFMVAYNNEIIVFVEV